MEYPNFEFTQEAKPDFNYNPVNFDAAFTITRNLWALRPINQPWYINAFIYSTQIILTFSGASLAADATILLVRYVAFPMAKAFLIGTWNLLLYLIKKSWEGIIETISGPAKRLLSTLSFAAAIFIIYILYTTGLWKQLFDLLSKSLQLVLSFLQ